jgi:hypothetical protein
VRSSRRVYLGRETGSIWLKLLLVLVVWILVPLAIAETGIRLWKPGFPGLRLPQVMHQPAELYGFELVPNQQVFNLASPVTTNSEGFRGPELRDRSDVGFRVLCIGDSFTFGYGVADGESYPSQLEQLLREDSRERDPEVVNAGVQGYATYHEMDFLESRGLGLQPDAVVLAVYHNDLVERPDGNYAARYHDELEQAKSNLRHRSPRLYWALHNSAAWTLGDLLYRARQHGSGPANGQTVAKADGNDAAWHSMAQELQTFKRLSQEHGFIPLIMVIPSRAQLAAENADSRYPGRVLAIVEELGLEAIDLRPVLKGAIEQGIDPYLAWDHHHGAEGNRLLAAAVRDRLVRAARTSASPGETAHGAIRSAQKKSGPRTLASDHE